jgi:SWI/SNF-related matrix-associated actin-dependent regulator of chromatin subfamily A protein 2/4
VSLPRQAAPPELRLACALERKALSLADAQRALRAEVAREAHLRGWVPPAAGAMPAARWDALADVSLLRRPLPASGRGALPETASEARASALAAAAAAQRAAAVAAQAAAARAAEEAARRAEGARAHAAATERANAAAAAAAAAADPAARAAAAAAARERAMADMRMRILSARRRFCASVTAASLDFRKHFTSGVFRRRRARNDGVMAFHARERAKLQRVETKRLQALRANDEEGYLRLVQESKNERLNTLLHKTAQLLAALGDKIKATQAAAAAGEEGVELVTEDDAGAAAGADAPGGAGGAAGEDGAAAGGAAGDGAGPSGEGGEGDSGGADLLARRRAYASAAHAITEAVTVQPAMLVGPHGNGKLRGYQLAGVQWMVSLYNNNLNGILADEMGLGKTIQTIALLAYLHERKGHRGPHLIVCPKAVLPNWAAEFAAWAPDLDVILYDGRPDERAALRGRVVAGAAGRGFCALLTHYDMIMRDKSLLAKLQWSYIIIDEGHRMKNRESRLAEVLCASYKSRHRLLLTGTPIQNNMGELWALLNFLLPAIFASAESFSSWFNAPFAVRVLCCAVLCCMCCARECVWRVGCVPVLVADASRACCAVLALHRAPRRMWR